ncbi:ATP-grasp domain-containing protein [Haloferula helveola]|uniref:ATP-grasp domain-containing protein n=1 Tax=Haloferula helveola TaxID=490095 RepID=A0ABM7RGX8_9BACT|nr:ATP-grasp domain-containing protein [Haloferula helveola]
MSSASLPNPRVLVTYGWVRSSWGLIRNLARHGLEVYVGDHQSFFMSRFSRYCSGWFQYPHFHADTDGFISAVVDYIMKHDIGVYIPSHEEGFLVAKHRDRFPDSVHVAVADYEAIRTLDHKLHAQQLAEELGVPHPATFEIGSESSLETSLPHLPEKGVIKVPFSHGSHGVSFFENHSELRERWARVMAEQPEGAPAPIVQQFVHGTIQTVMVLAEKGEVKANFARRNVREKETFGGAAVKCESILFPEALEDATRIVRHLSYSGVAMFEYIVDRESGERWLMEVNPRYWGTTPHDLNCGVSYPYYQYCLAHGLPFRENPEYPLGHRSRWIAGDVISYFKNPRSERGFRVARKHLDFDDDSFMDFSIDDPVPFLVQSYLYYKHRAKIFSKR